MSPSRKINKRSSSNYNKNNSMNSNSKDVLTKLDGLRSNIKEEHKSMGIPSSNNNIKIFAVLAIIVVGSAGFLLIYNPTILPSTGGGGGTKNTNIISVAGNFKQDTLATPFLIGNKVSFIYVGGQYCPYCAMERWAIVMALSNFGNFSNYSFIRSAEGNIPTYDFVGITYTSNTVEFQGVEAYNNVAPPHSGQLESLTGDAATYYSKYGGTSIPFICIGGSIFQSGAGNSFDVNSFTGQSQSTIQNQISSKSGTLYDQIHSESQIITQLIYTNINSQNTTTASSTTSG